MPVLIFWLCSLVFLQMPVIQKNQPRIELDTTLLEFGTLMKGEQDEKTVTIFNRGTTDLVIHDILSSCACVAMNEERMRLIPPGKSQGLVVRLSTASKVLELNDHIIIKSNDPENDSIVVKITAFVHVDYKVSGETLQFPDICEGMQTQKRIRVRSYMDRPLEIGDFKSPYDYIHCTFLPGGEQNEYFIEVALDTRGVDLKTRSFNPRISFTSNSTQLPKGVLTFFLQTVKDIKADPGVVTLLKKGDQPSNEVRVALKNVKGKKFSVARVNPGFPCVDVEVEPGEATTLHLTLRLNDKAQKGRLSSGVRVFFNYEDQEELMIPLKVVVLP